MKDTIVLPLQILQDLSTHWELLTFQTDCDFNYENQILKGAIALIEGKVEVIKKRKIIEVLLPGQIIGLSSFKLNKKVNFRLRIKADAKIIFFNKSAINNLNKYFIKNE
jgi:hypothetical protein